MCSYGLPDRETTAAQASIQRVVQATGGSHAPQPAEQFQRRQVISLQVQGLPAKAFRLRAVLLHGIQRPLIYGLRISSMTKERVGGCCPLVDRPHKTRATRLWRLRDYCLKGEGVSRTVHMEEGLQIAAPVRCAEHKTATWPESPAEQLRNANTRCGIEVD